MMEEKLVARDAPQPEEARRSLVKQICDDVESAKFYYKKARRRITADQDFAYGRQWSSDDEDDRYVANIVLRHIQQRTAVLYAKNPKAIAKRKEAIDYTVWDGRAESIAQAQEAMATSAMMALPVDPRVMAIVQDHAQVMQRRQMLDRLGRTLELTYGHYVSEQLPPFKKAMKRLVRRAVTTGVGYVKLGFQRAMERRPEVAIGIADAQDRLSHIERMAADLADDQTGIDDAEAEELREAIKQLEQEPMLLIREGLTFDFPNSTAIIPDTKCRSLDGFVGCDWVAEEFLLSPEEVQEIYDTDVKSSYTTYHRRYEMPYELSGADGGTHDRRGKARDVLVWEVYHRKDGLLYVVADGYPDFLKEPAAPPIFLERFWPWFTLMFNEIEHEKEIYPPSDVHLLRPMQMEYNRAREGLSEHRAHNRPKTVVPAGLLDRDDEDELMIPEAHAVIQLKALQPNQKIDDVLQPWRGNPIDPNLYDTNPTFTDTLRQTGTQDANIGPTSGATATETSIAEGSRLSSLESSADDLDDMLTELARAGGQVLLMEVSEATVQEIAGPGAVWPQLDRETIAKEILLEVQAGSSGRPNKAQELANLERVMPFLVQIPEIKPLFLATETLKRMDDRLDVADAFQSGLPSITAMNAMARPSTSAVPNAPEQQAGQGRQNAEQPQQSENQPPRAGRPPMAPVNPRQFVGND